MAHVLIFSNLVDYVNTIISFVYNFCLSDYQVILNYLFHNVHFIFTTFNGSIVTFSSLPEIPILSGVIEQVFRVLFDPLFYFGAESLMQVPFCFCLISFVIKGSLIILLVKMVKLGIITS